MQVLERAMIFNIMTLPEWNIILSAATVGLITGGGLWLKYVVDQQLKTKDIAIQALDAVVKVKDAQIAALQSDTAPAIAKAYDVMRQHADQITAKSQKLAEVLEEIAKKHEQLEQSFPVRLKLAEAKGFVLAGKILGDGLNNLCFVEGQRHPVFADPDAELILNGLFDTLEKINSEGNDRITGALRQQSKLLSE